MKTIRRTDIFANWLTTLKDKAGMARIAVRIERLAMGNPGSHRNLTDGVSELKIPFGPGYRVYYTERADEIVILLCGGSKKTQPKDIKRAQDMVQQLDDEEAEEQQ